MSSPFVPASVPAGGTEPGSPFAPGAVPGPGGLGAVLFDSTLAVAANSIDTGAGAIPSGHYVVAAYLFARSDEAVVFSVVNVTVNGDTGANYDLQYLSGNNANATANTSLAQTKWANTLPGASAAASSYGVLQLTFPNYDGGVGHLAGSLEETIADATAADAVVLLKALRWRSTTALSRLTFTLATGAAKMLAGSRLTVIGW